MSLLTNFLKLFKWDTTSETDLDEEFDIDAAMNENWDKIDAKAKEHDDSINTLEDVQAEQDSLIQKLKDNMINLTTEEDTSLYVNDAGTPPASLKIMGNHRQETREGYNLAKISNYDTTFSGITLKSNIDEGYISATGTSTGASAPIATVTLPAGDYVFSGGPANGSASTQRLSIYKNEAGTFNNVYTLYGDRTYTVNLTEETTFRLNYVIPSGTTVNNEKIYPMIVSGTETKPFQVYGVMPSVEYPSEIETVGNNINYFNKDIEVLDGYISLDGTWHGSATTGYTESYQAIRPNTEYTLSGLEYSDANSRSSIYRIYIFNKDKEMIEKTSADITTTEYTFTTPEGATYIDYQVDKEAFNESKDKIKLETEDDYIVINKINSNIMPIVSLGTNWEYTEKGIKNLAKNTGSSITSFNLKKGQTIKINFKLFSKPTADTTFSVCVDGIEQVHSMFVGFNEYILNQVYTRTYTATEDCELRITLWGNANSETFEFQLWANLNEVKDYVQYVKDSYILDIQQEMLKGDDFDLENNKEVHNWKKYTITNINEFTNVTKEGSTFRFIKNVTNGNQISDVICNMCKKWNNSWSETGCFISYDSKFYLMIKFGDYGFTEAMTVDEAKTHMNEFLSITSLVFYYTTSTTTQLDLTTEQKEVLAQLNNLDLFKGINNIYTEEGIALIQLDYTADTKMYIDKVLGSEG